MEDVRVSNVTMRDVLCPFTVNLHYACGAWGDPVVSDKGFRQPDAGTPRLRGISLSNVLARGVTCAATLSTSRTERMWICARAGRQRPSPAWMPSALSGLHRGSLCRASSGYLGIQSLNTRVP